MLSLYAGVFLAGLGHAVLVGLVLPAWRDVRDARRREELPVASPAVIAAFLCGCGGSGSVVTLTRDVPALATIGASCLSGTLVAALVVTLTRGLFPASGLDDPDLDL